MRIETGPHQFENDWPGFFIRGDEAIGIATVLKLLAGSIELGDEVALKGSSIYLRSLANQLESCGVKKCA